MAAVLRKWRTEGQQTILRAGMIIDLSSTRSPPQPNPTQDKGSYRKEIYKTHPAAFKIKIKFKMEQVSYHIVDVRNTETT